MFGGSISLVNSVYRHLTQKGISVIQLKSGHLPTGLVDVILDPRGYLSRGVNIPGLTLGISLTVPESKETLIHQWGRIARQGQKNGEFHMIIPQDDLEQLEYMSFQLGVQFEERRASPLHPFQIELDSEKRFSEIQKLVSRLHF